MMTKRIRAAEMRRKLLAGDGSLLVAVTSPAGYARAHLEGAISFEDFERRLPSLEKEREIVFY